MGEDQINRLLASIPIVGQVYLSRQLRNTVLAKHRIEIEKTSLAREASEIEQSRASLEAELQRAQPKLDALEQLRKCMETHKSDMAVLLKDRDSLHERIQATECLAKANALGFLSERSKKERWKTWAHALKEIVQESDVKAEDAMRVAMPHIIDVLGIRVLLFNENEEVEFATSAAAERLGKSREQIAHKRFSHLFDCPSIGWLLDVGPRYPLFVNGSQEEIGASVAEIPYGTGATYAVSLREAAAKQGLVRRLVPQRLAAPPIASAEYRCDVACALATSTRKSRIGNDVYIDLRNTKRIEPEFGAWLATIIAERNESDRQGTVFLCMPSESVYEQLRRCNIPDKNIKLPRRTESMRYFEYHPVLLARGT